jgi:hypothetical protein
MYRVSFSSSVLDEIAPYGMGSQAHPMLDPLVFKEACDRINGFCDRNGIPPPQSILPDGTDVIVIFPNDTQADVFRSVSGIWSKWSVSVYP